MAKKKLNESLLLRGLDGLAYGYFVTYVLGNALLTLGNLFGWPYLGGWAESMVHLIGPGIGIGIAYAIGSKGMVLLSSAIAGMILVNDHFTWMICTYVAVMVASFIGRYFERKTPLDIFIAPTVTIVIAGILAVFVQPYLDWLGQFLIYQLENVLEFPPILMGMLLAVIMGFLSVTPLMILPICTSLNLSGLAAGAAIAGTCSMTLGLMIMSLDDNEVGDVIAIGIGGSLLQFKNILKHPLILLPPLLSSLVCGFLSVSVFQLLGLNYGVGSVWQGMQAIVSVMGYDFSFMVLLVDGLIPIILTYSTCRILRKLNWISGGDLTINRL